MARAVLRQLLFLFAIQLTHLAPVHSSSDTTSYANVSEALPQLEDLVNFPLRRHPWLGGQNFTVCCLKAVNASYQDQNGQVSLVADVESQFINLSPDDLNATQFPCGASYNGSDLGAPLVTIPYSWCKTNCGGWQQSTNRILTQWIQPFVGFILPAAVFCLNVPRKMVIRISDDLFRGRYKTISIYYKRINFKEAILQYSLHTLKFGALLLLVFVEIVLRGAWAASIALADTIIWVAIVFSTAGPMILSGLYEATLDRKVIEKIQGKNRWYQRLLDQENEHLETELKKLQRDMRQEKERIHLKLHLLYAVLVGNLNMYKAEPKKTDPEKGELKKAEPENSRSAWEDIKLLIEPFTKLDKPYTDHDKHSTQIRLRGMLGCQASFGAAIGAPVVFFLGSFFFSVFSDLSTIGDNDTSHALAFGMWWMTIPHVAIVAGCLLAGNNPNTLEVIISGETSWETPIPDSHVQNQSTTTFVEDVRNWLNKTLSLAFFVREGRRKHFWHYLSLYRPFYDSVYQPVWMWERGRSKRTWLRQVEEDFDNRREPPRELPKLQPYTRYTKTNLENFDLTLGDWIYIILVALSLMATPLILAFLTSFYTPTVGLSCRSFTFLMYFIFQFLISLIWLWDFQWEERSPLLQEGSTWMPSPYCIFMTLGLAGSLFTTIAGTFLQILGVYRNCLCSIPISAWSSGDYSIVISTNSADDIKYAEHFWLPTGVTSIVVLILVCYIGWWYQRHWRRRFTVVIDKWLWHYEKLLGEKERLLTNAQSSSTEKKLPQVTQRSIAESNGANVSPEIKYT